MKTAKIVQFFVVAMLVSVATLLPTAKAQTNGNSFQISFYTPTNGQVYVGPANVWLNAHVVDPNIVQTVAYFSGTTLIATVTNTTTNGFYYFWSNVGLGSYTLTAVGTDSVGNTATSAPITISVQTPPPPHPSVAIYSPANNSALLYPTNVSIYARAVETNNPIQQVQFFAGTSSLGIVTNSAVYSNISSVPLYKLTWTNPSPGNYPLTAVAMDTQGITATSTVVNISVVTNIPPPPPGPHPLAVVSSPGNGYAFLNPTNVSISAFADEANSTIRWVELFAGTNLLVTATNTTFQTNYGGQAFYVDYSWLNPPPGSQALTAVAMDSQGNLGTSSVVTISILTNPPAIPFVVGWESPTPSNGQTYAMGTTIGMHAWVTDSNTVSTMQYFANSTLLTTITNSRGVLLTNTGSDPLNLFGFGWSHPPVGSYVLTAVATDITGATATSAPVTFQVLATNNLPPVVRITSPPEAASFRSPVNIPIYAYAIDTDGYVKGVEFFAGTNDLGPATLVPRGTNASSTNYYGLYYYTVWSNAPVGTWPLTARATDNSNAVTVSLPVNITVLPPGVTTSNVVPIALISAIDPVAIEGTNCWVWPGMTNAVPNWSNWIGATVVPFTNCGPKNATFRVYHTGDTNNPLTINYSIGGTASNGIDYVTLPGTVTIPAGQRTAMISIVPIDDGPPDTNSTVILRLTPSTTVPPSYYTYGMKAAAEAVILDGPPAPPAPTATATVLPDQTFHLNASGPNGAWFRVEASPDMQVWTPICTNQVVNGSIDFADPNASNSASQYYRAVPEANAPQ